MKLFIKMTVFAFIFSFMGQLAQAKENSLLTFAQSYKGAAEVLHRAYLSKAMPRLNFETPKGSIWGNVISWGSQDITVIYAHDDNHLYFFKNTALKLTEITKKQLQVLNRDKSNRFTASKSNSDALDSKYVKTVPKNFGELALTISKLKKSPSLKIGYTHAFDQKPAYQRTPLFYANSSYTFYQTDKNKLNIIPNKDILYIAVPVHKNWFKRYQAKYN